MNDINIYTIPKPTVLILRDKIDEYAKLKVDFYLNLLNNKKVDEKVIAMDHTISFVQDRAVINFTIDIVIYNNALEPIKYIVIEDAKKGSKLFKHIIKLFYSACSYEGQNTLKNFAVLNPKTKRVTCIDYSKYNTYKKWKLSGYKFINCV